MKPWRTPGTGRASFRLRNQAWIGGVDKADDEDQAEEDDRRRGRSQRSAGLTGEDSADAGRISRTNATAMNTAGRTSRVRKRRSSSGGASEGPRRQTAAASPTAAGPATISKDEGPFVRVSAQSWRSSPHMNSFSPWRAAVVRGNARGPSGQPVNEIVPMIGIEMESRRLPAPAAPGELRPVEPRRMPPALLSLLVFFRRVGRVADEIGRARAKPARASSTPFSGCSVSVAKTTLLPSPRTCRPRFPEDAVMDGWVIFTPPSSRPSEAAFL